MLLSLPNVVLGFLTLATAFLTDPRQSSHSPTLYTAGDISGCNAAKPLPGITHYRHITSSGIRRTYGIHIPAGYNPPTQYPVIVGFHGSSSIGLFFEVDTRLSSSKYTSDKLVVYPDGVGGAWAGASYSKATLEQDFTFVKDLLADVRSNFCVDSARIYATGMSNGGGFVGSLACNTEVGGEFAAFAPVSGSFYTDATGQGCTPARKVTPILEFHGGRDESVHYEGGPGDGGYEPPIAEWVSRWAARNGCGEIDKTVEDSFGGDVHHTVYSCGGQYGVVQHYKTDSQKHAWPSTDPNFSQLAAGDGPTHLEASQIIQNFFANFSRPAG